MKKILFVARLAEHINHFHLPYIDYLKQQGYSVDVATVGDEELVGVDHHFIVPMQRNPFSKSNFKSYKMLKNIIEKEDYNIIHCHMPLSGILTRLASRKARKKGASLLYTAHGFHFYEGAPLLYWMIYYPIEKIVSWWTDCIITINKEDYEIAKSKLHSKNVKLVNGIGVDIDEFSVIDELEKTKLRKEYGFNENDYILIYVAELSNRKNQEGLLETVKKLKETSSNFKLLLVGRGTKRKTIEEKIKQYDLVNNVLLLGYRKDINNLMKLSDIAVSTSKQEGLPVNILEAMATGLPAVVTNCRGNRDLIKDSINGFVLDDEDKQNFAEKLLFLEQNEKLRLEFGNQSRVMVEKYTLESVLTEMKKIYSYYLKD